VAQAAEELGAKAFKFEMNKKFLSPTDAKATNRFEINIRWSLLHPLDNFKAAFD
jgi:hypothetical protein